MLNLLAFCGCHVLLPLPFIVAIARFIRQRDASSVPGWVLFLCVLWLLWILVGWQVTTRGF